MYVIHVKDFRVKAAAAVGVVLLLTAVGFLLSGCLGHGKAEKEAVISAGTSEERLALLTERGWEVEPEPVETLQLRLPEDLGDDYADYAALQAQQGLPFSACAGKAVERFTYRVTNFPDYDGPVQVNLYVCEGRLIGGDVIAMGENGFQQGLDFPA